MKKFVFISLGLVIIYLLLQNVGVYTKIITTVTDLFGKSFRAVTNVGDFK